MFTKEGDQVRQCVKFKSQELRDELYELYYYV